MPELPDIQVYLEALERTVVGQRLERIRLGNPFLVRSIDPPIETFHQRDIAGVSRLGKRIVIEFDGEDFLIVHLMIAGRLRWKKAGTKLPGRNGLAAFDFAHGSLLLTEAGSRRRASLHAVHGPGALDDHDRRGLEVLECGLDEFRQRLQARNHTLKRVLCDPTAFSGIGNAYSDEILHRARLSPFKLSTTLELEEVERLYEGARTTLVEWIDRLREKTGAEFPDKVTAFHPEMAVHGKFREPCPDCGSPVQRIVYAENEANYCPTCQTGGKLLKDRALSRLLRDDWPRSIDEMEAHVAGRQT
jgi:formamidopyrimidine-DNA glycosylase